MNIAVVGAGAMGSLFGGLLKKAGNRVLLIDVWADHVDAICREGLIIDRDGRREVVSIPACRPAEATEAVDLVIVFTKSFQTETALHAVRRIISDETFALTLQNGVGHVEIIEAFVPRSRIIHGVTTYPCDLSGPGHIRSRGAGTIRMMSVDGTRHPRGAAIAEEFRKAGLDCEIAPDVQVAIWEKLAFNAALNSLTAVLGLTVGQVGDAREGRDMATQIVDEVVAVARKLDIPVDSDRILATVSMAFDHHRDHRPSMLQDVRAKRKTEIDFINGAVIRRAKQLGLAAPANETMYRLMKIIENADAEDTPESMSIKN